MDAVRKNIVFYEQIASYTPLTRNSLTMINN